MVTIGVLALQGAVEEHVRFLEKSGSNAVRIKWPEQLKDIDGLIIPGGESTTMRKLIDHYEFLQPLQAFGESGKPVFGTCAGMILMAERLSNDEEPHLGFIDMTVERNAFGRQKESFEAIVEIKDVAVDVEAVFIRAPLVQEVGHHVTVLSEYDDTIVAVREGNYLACSFHPELTSDYRLHEAFVHMVEEAVQG
ncbi:pyridoxal 5'-phosphate synthase glutaminase subunit PdxT [Geomicrobium sp. JCM 19055]|uniref:pyridoxal 5'-phosphate synthase glutaminase subunit PdxT n=1 Tax=Geomicrobium sp. JCM 19055 TaxID=1460649 RepID=UPI00045ED5D0|nr:pyridoxal 5'-phosphate synthase glutaminase subunit PdxT [Geomicrobium sp. JCM 19055]GAJ99632.1 pyridoxine biosynthesis glutamine amidotransferase, glutaminase subunit [Geomicrobium sp. JCM 19055]